MRIVILALGCLALGAGELLAQTLPPAAPTGGVDFGPIATSAITALAGVLTIAAGILTKFAISFLASKTGLSDSQAEALAASRVNDILLRSIDFAEAWAKTQVADPQSQIRHVKIDNFFMEQAVRFFLSSAPDLVKLFGLTRDRIESMILARLNPIMPTPGENQGRPTTFGQLNVASPEPSTGPATVPPTVAGPSAS